MRERLLDLGGGLAVWRVSLDLLRERDKNARVMDDRKFRRLAANISEDRRLESLPLCYLQQNDEFGIISGHHRVRAARSAGFLDIPVLVIEETLTDDQVKAKQLSHNALNGRDDEQVLAEIYASIQDVEERIRTGVFEEEIKDKLKALGVDEITIDLDYQVVNMVFLSAKKRQFDDVLRMLEADSAIYSADLDQFEAFAGAVRQVSKAENVRNIATILGKMVEIVQAHYAETLERA